MSTSSHENPKVQPAHLEDATGTGTVPPHLAPRRSNQLSHQISQYSITLTPEQYERAFLSAQPKVGDAAYRFGNPTSLGLLAFAIAMTPVSMALMRWGGTSVASLPAFVPQFYALGGICLLIAGVGEFIIGNTITFTVFLIFSGFAFELAFLFDPMHNIAGAFEGGGLNAMYNNGLGLHWACWAFGVMLLFLASLRINVVFAIAFASLDVAFALFSAAFFKLGHGASPSTVNDVLQASGAVLFITCVAIWYLTFNFVLATTGMPFALPVGDLSGSFKGRQSRIKA